MTIKERVYASRVLEKAERNAEYAETIGVSYSLISGTQLANSIMQSGPISIDKTEGKPADAAKS